MEKIKVCSFNLRVISEKDGENIFYNRRARILETIEGYSPDLIGFQEALDVMRDFLRDELCSYTVIGCGRNPDYRGEGAPIAFKSDRFELIRFESFWLSPTPDLPGSRYENQSNCPRIVSAALLSPRDGEPFWFINTHLDHKSSEARLLGANQLVKYIEKLDKNFVMTGDFNAAPDAPEILALVTSERISNATEGIGGTIHHFSKTNEQDMPQIDYIFTDMDFSGGFAVPNEPKNGIYISDHKPVIAFVHK